MLTATPAIQFSARSNSFGLKKKKGKEKEIPQIKNMANCYMTHTKAHAVFHRAGMKHSPNHCRQRKRPLCKTGTQWVSGVIGPWGQELSWSYQYFSVTGIMRHQNEAK